MIMEVRKGIFAGDDPFVIARRWLDEATQTEVNDPNAIALSTVDADGLPNARMVLLKKSKTRHSSFIQTTPAPRRKNWITRARLLS